MIVLSAALLAVLVLIAAVVWLFRQERRFWTRTLADREREHVADREAWTGLLERERAAHRTEVAQLHQARMEETANLLQRIQAPAQAVTSHVADTAPPDPAPVNLEDDEQLFELYENRLRNLANG